MISHKIFQYLYLLAAILFFIDAILEFFNNQSSWWIKLLLGLAAVFMFFLKRKFAKDYGNK